MEWYIGAACMILLLFVLCRECFARRRLQAGLRQIAGKLKEIQDTGSGEYVTVMTENPELIELVSQTNRLLASNRQLAAEFRRSELAKKRMLSNISHDIKTPMTVLLGYLEIMRLKGAKEELLEKTEQKAQDVMKLINQFFTLAKLEAGDKELKLSRLDICEICRKTILDFYEVLTEQGFLVEAAIPEQPVFIRGNEEALERILNNLISNAIRYGVSGGFLGISVRMEEKMVYVEVMDKGQGVDPVFAERIFERLFMMEDSRSRRIQGNGLGLTIARSLAEQMGGMLTLNSIPEVETVFTLSLPAGERNL